MKKTICILLLICILGISFCFANSNAKGGFKKDGDSFVTKKELSGTFTNTNGIKNGSLKFSIRISGDDVFIVLKEKGEVKALSTIKSLAETFTVDISYGTTTQSYQAKAIKNEKNIFNTIKIDGISPLFASNKTLSITIFNDYGSYSLGKINTSEIESLRYNKAPYSESLALIKDGKYQDALKVLEAFKKSDSDSFYFYDCDGVVEDCIEALAEMEKNRNESIYQEALAAYLNGNYAEALTLFEKCSKGYEDSDSAIIECRKMIGLHYPGEVITLGRDKKGKPVEWIILGIKEEAALVISKNLLFEKSYNDKDVAVTWETCSLRKYLNDNSSSGFLGSYFTEAEKKKIIVSTIVNEDNPEYGTPGGNETKDSIFVLSLNEACEYANNIETTNSWEDCWWTRTPGFDSEYVVICASPHVYYLLEGLAGNTVFRSISGNAFALKGTRVNNNAYPIFVRPAMRVNLD